MTEARILIAGGGIGGLTAALCLAEKGFVVSVFEKAAELSEVGAGIQLSPNCTRVLHYLGLESALRAFAFLPVGTQFRHWRSGKVINESPLGDDVVSRYGMPYYHIHRADLLSVLADAAHASANISVHTGSRVTSFTQNDSQVQIQTESNGHSTSHSGSALFGADGIHSVIRAQLWGAQSACFTGNIAWRLTVPSARLPEGLIRPMSTAWWGPGKHFVHYFVRTGSLVNCVCVVEKKGWEVESWTERGDSSELEEDFAGWHDDVQQLIQNGDAHSLYKWALFDRAPMRRWGRGRVSLLGDACHPTLPFMAQGAAMAIEDGAVLANCLSQSNDITAAMDRYESLRRERTAGIQQGSRRNARVFHLSGVKAWVRNRAVRVAGKHARDTLFRYNALEAGK